MVTVILPARCWLCGKEVAIDDCEIVEPGNVVHRDCHEAKMRETHDGGNSAPEI
jgi:hypothetical protein